MRRISLSLAIAALALLAFGAFQMTASAASPNLGDQQITLAPGQKIALPIRFWSLVYGQPSTGQFQGPQPRATDAVVKTVLSALLDGNAIAHPDQAQLAVWYAVDNTWHADPVTETLIAQQIISDSLQIELPTLPDNIPTLDKVIAQGKLTSSFLPTRTLPGQPNDGQSENNMPLLEPGQVDARTTQSAITGNGLGTLIIQNVSKQRVTFLWVQGLTLVPMDGSSNQVLVVARDLPRNEPGTPTPTQPRVPAGGGGETAVPTSTPTVRPTRSPVAAQAQATSTPTRTRTPTATTTPTGAATEVPTETGVATEVATETVAATLTAASTASTTGTATSTPTLATETTEPTAVGTTGQLPTGGGEPFVGNLSAFGYILAGLFLLLVSGGIELYRLIKNALGQ